MAKRIGSLFKKVKNEMYTKHSNGFYVRAKAISCTPDKAIKYISRYLGRPAIATSRIDNYDGDFVTFHYNKHEDDTLVTETIPALDFIKRLIVHIPEKHYKMLRYYAFMPNIINKKKTSGNAFPMKNVNYYVPYSIGETLFFYPSDMIH